MNQASPAAFKFESYQIGSFKYADAPKEHKDLPMRILFAPKGIFDIEEALMNVELGVKVSYVKENDGEPVHELIECEMNAFFKFKNAASLDDIPGYFYRNAIAILFPYLRSFITTLTAVANTTPLILPLMNLIALEQEFKDNITLRNLAEFKSADIPTKQTDNQQS